MLNPCSRCKFALHCESGYICERGERRFIEEGAFDKTGQFCYEFVGINDDLNDVENSQGEVFIMPTICLKCRHSQEDASGKIVCDYHVGEKAMAWKLSCNDFAQRDDQQELNNLYHARAYLIRAKDNICSLLCLDHLICGGCPLRQDCTLNSMIAKMTAQIDKLERKGLKPLCSSK